MSKKYFQVIAASVNLKINIIKSSEEDAPFKLLILKELIEIKVKNQLKSTTDITPIPPEQAWGVVGNPKSQTQHLFFILRCYCKIRKNIYKNKTFFFNDEIREQ